MQNYQSLAKKGKSHQFITFCRTGITVVLLSLLFTPNVAISQTYKNVELAQVSEREQQEMVKLVEEAVQFTNQGQFSKALGNFQQALKIAKQSGDKTAEGLILNYVGVVYRQQGQYQKALENYQQALNITREVGNKSIEASTLNNIGVVYRQQGQYLKALENYQQSLVILIKIGAKDREGETLSNIGTIYTLLGKYPQALNNYQQALDVAKKIGNKLGESQSLNGIGEVYRLFGEYSKALENYQLALAIIKEIANKSLEGRLLSNIGLLYTLQEQYPKALENYQLALAIAEESGDKPTESVILNNIGGIYDAQKQYPKALLTYQKSLDIVNEIGDKAGKVTTLSNIGGIFAKQKQYPKALENYQQALGITKEIGYKPGEGQILNNIGETYVIQGKYSQAETNLFAAVEIWELLRQGKLTDEQKISILGQQSFTYSVLQRALIAQNKIEQALEVSERGRARAFVDLLTERAANNNSAIGKLPTITQIKQIAQKQKSTFVEYSLVLDKLYIWIVKNTGKIAFEQVDLKSLKIPLEKLVEDSRLSIGVQGRGIQVLPVSDKNSKNRLQQLHEILIKPITKHLPKNSDERVVFIPHQSLFLVPFSALVDENNKYLVEKHSILTAPAIQVLEFTDKNNPQTTKFASLKADEKLIVGNPIMPYVGVPPTRLSNLPGSEVEAKLIASLLNTKPLIGKEATKSVVMQRMKNAKLIHLATHGLLDGFGERIPGAIVLSADTAPSRQQPNEGLLRTREIIENLKLQADLIVLSACDTGKGKISGDGVQGLSRALLTVGAKSLIVSLWEVPDAATSDLMLEFYKQLEKNPDKASALRQAMLKTMQKYPGAANWAAFTIIGNPE